MGNCLVVAGKVIKVMKTDGKILEYRAPIKVHEVLTEFSGHAISDSLPEIRQLGPDFKLLGGNLYYLVPVPYLPSQKVEHKKKKVRFSDDQEVEDGAKEAGVVRVKLVISKQELKYLLQKGGISVQDMVSQIENRQSDNIDQVECFEGGDNRKGWKPELESIPEVD